jgi:hypothetical protein
MYLLGYSIRAEKVPTFLGVLRHTSGLSPDQPVHVSAWPSPLFTNEFQSRPVGHPVRSLLYIAFFLG